MQEVGLGTGFIVVAAFGYWYDYYFTRQGQRILERAVVGHVPWRYQPAPWHSNPAGPSESFAPVVSQTGPSRLSLAFSCLEPLVSAVGAHVGNHFAAIV